MKQEIKGYIKSRTWDVDDTFLIIETQVDSTKFKPNEKVNIVVSSLEE